MHIPDGYISPATCGVLYLTAAPFWVVAANKVRRALTGRTVPLLSIFAAFTFAIMMFNVPVPGGTTAHGVGGTLTAIVLGPWASVITTSVALILQALFFGDGGITAIGANCFNMAIVLPFAGYFSYRLLAGDSDMRSQRRVIAAAIGSYIGISIAALCVGVELGIQPHLWSTNGVPDYSPYGFSTAIPSMLLAHLAGASFVEAAITALAVGYLQRSFPEILTRNQKTGTTEPGRAINPWLPAGAFCAFAVAFVFIAGLIKGNGHLASWAGLDWNSVSWNDAAATVLVSAVVSVVVLPVTYYVMRRARGARVAVMVFLALMIWVPVGLIAPGGAFGEDASATRQEIDAAVAARNAGDASLFEALPDVNQECACVPVKINSVTFSGHTVLAGYQPPWVQASDPAWQQNIGYQVAGLVGVGILGLLSYGLYQFGRWLVPQAPPDWRTA
ncbi:MAG TPA: cobalt transporter CbiM [Dehalococcoidia bacterium]|nr:cobalt transporter CbiM [Dehalococcoidia bacterium]